MDRRYDTQTLIEILDNERQACLQGERLHLSSDGRSGHPIIDQFLQLEGLQKYSAFQGFKAAVNQYQRDHGVSGIVWQAIALGGASLEFPTVHPQLIALPSDLALLRQYITPVLAFWQRVTADLDLYLAVDQGKNFLPTQPAAVMAMVPRSQWATVQAWERQDFLEILLQLGWGQPGAAAHWRAWPASGSEYIHGVLPGRQPIC